MSDILQSARQMSHIFLRTIKEEISEEDLLSVIDKVSAMNIIPGETFDREELFDILKSDFSIGKGQITVLNDDVIPWLTEEKSNINFELWNRYKMNISENDPSFPVNDLDDFTDIILDKCNNPKEQHSFDRRGMVVGHVQSGKTANYVGLINKATDAGYKLIIVLAGTIGSLRRQTQERIDSGYTGRSSSAFIQGKDAGRIVGVGKIPVKSMIIPFTSSFYKNGDEGDFNGRVANSLSIDIGKQPVVLVIKKNKSILENLIDWLSKDVNYKEVDGVKKIFDVPTLIIDDEADAASVNASKSISDIKTINALIRVLINMFNQSTFVGYTATPYANLFISQLYDDSVKRVIKGKEYLIGEDLFPKHFIVNIKAPSNYIGASKIFGLEDPVTGESNEPLPLFRQLIPNEFEDIFPFKVNSSTPLPDIIPGSLEKAIKHFIITCAVRRLRGHEKKHNSMLVHVALLVKWIDRVALLVNESLRDMKDKIAAGEATIFRELKEIYESDFMPTTETVLQNMGYTDMKIKVHPWDEVEKEIKKAASKIIVRAVHGRKTTANLDYHDIQEIDYNLYPDGLSVIAVGGTRLSRGITLEGLSVSYYLRTTKMYDSLMQMGRWFGYRPGYVDLCRIFTTEEVFDWFNHITVATEEMRNDFDLLHSLQKKPSDFRLKVRNHSGLLTVTSLLKMNFAETLEISFSGQNPQTYKFLKLQEIIENNYNAFKKLINELGLPPAEDRIKNVRDGNLKYLLYRDVNTDALCNFIDSYRIDQPNIKNATLTSYIKKQEEEKNISEWSIAVVNNNDKKVHVIKDYTDTKEEVDAFGYKLNVGGETVSLQCSVRNQPVDRRREKDYFIPQNQIDDVKDRQADLGTSLSKNSDIKEERKKQKKGLMLIYALDPRGTLDIEKTTPVIGFSLHFPQIENEAKVSYTVTLQKDLYEDPQENDDEEVITEENL